MHGSSLRAVSLVKMIPQTRHLDLNRPTALGEMEKRSLASCVLWALGLLVSQVQMVRKHTQTLQATFLGVCVVG